MTTESGAQGGGLVYIYALSDPETGEVRYIGKTVNPRKRLRCHCVPLVRGRASHKEKWIGTLRKRGFRPVMTILEAVADPEQAAAAQVRLIRNYREQGAPLVNGTAGGDGAEGYVHSADSRAKMSRIARGRSPELQARVASAMRAGRATDEARAKYAAASKKRWQDPAFQALRSRAARAAGRQAAEALRAYRASLSPEERAAIEERRVAALRGDAVRKKLAAASAAHRHSEQTKQKISAIGKALYQDPAFRAKMQLVCADPERSARISRARQGTKASPETRAKMSASQKARRIRQEKGQEE